MAQMQIAEPIKELSPDERWERYLRMALTPEEVAEGRAELQKEIDRARVAGVYEELKKWKGKIRWDVSLDELREDRD
jgi:hypothetical protein